VDAIERVTDKFVAVREPGERFLDTYRRVGFEAFKEAIYG
jgi:sulfite reductase (NADPH) hemoprotein beta-component